MAVAPSRLELQPFVAALRSGGIVAYPTEAVYGLGCDPENQQACGRLFALKQRAPGQGVLLIGADFEQIRPWIDLEATPAAALDSALASWPGAHTWIFPRHHGVPGWLVGEHRGIGVRVTAHPVAAALCRAFGKALVSTSANRHGTIPARSAAEAREIFGDDVSIIDGALGDQERPTPIRDVITGELVRH